MKQEDIELYAFLFFGSREDQDLLLGRKPLTYKDFSRFVYLADFFDMHCFLQKLWDTYGERFLDQTAKLEHMFAEKSPDSIQQEQIDEKVCEIVKEQEGWLSDFCEHTQSGKKKTLRRIVEEICREKGIS